MQVKIATSRKPDQSQPGGYVQYSPFRMFEDFINDWASRVSPSQGESWKPSVDVLEKDGNLILRMEIPGVNEKDVEIKLEGTVLTVKGERKNTFESEGYNSYQIESYYGPFSRSFTLPETIDPEKIGAQYKNGVLTITLPQKPEVKPRSIKISL
jgi:HSP20 family protein